MNTNNLEEFGYREMGMAGELLTAYSEGCGFLGRRVKLEFNSSSGIVFLVDEDCNVGVMEDKKLVQFYNCPECGEEGTAHDFRDLADPNDCCVNMGIEIRMEGWS
jgi:hypothetical protein